MPTVTIGIGVPGSGKTTWLVRHSKSAGTVYVCPDDVRKELFGDATVQSGMNEVWREVYDRIAEALGEGHDVVVDATNARRDDRRRLVEHCKLDRGKGKVTVIGAWFRTPVDVCVRRRADPTQRNVRAEVIEGMAKALEEHPPSQDDGFDAVVDVLAL